MRLILGTGAVLIAAGLAAWLANTRALSPLTRIVRLAARVAEEGDFSRRVTEDPRDSEIASLTATLNRLVHRVDEVLVAQRQFVADTSHELKTLLTTINGTLELLEHDLSPGERSETLREMREELRRMVRLVCDLLLLAEVGEPGGRERHQLRLDQLTHTIDNRIAGDRVASMQVVAEDDGPGLPLEHLVASQLSLLAQPEPAPGVPRQAVGRHGSVIPTDGHS